MTKPAGANIRSALIPEDVYANIKDFAEENLLSNSEAILDLMEAYLAGEAETPRGRTSRRVTFWIPDARWGTFQKFQQQVKKDRTTIAGALEAALKQEMH